MSDKKAITLKEAADAYLEHLGKSGTKEATVNVYRLCRARHNRYYAESRIMPSKSGI